MSVSLFPPDLRRIFSDLQRRVGILERRVTPAVAAAETADGSHDGTSPDSVQIGNSANPAVAGGDQGELAVGAGAVADDFADIAIGWNSESHGPSQSIAIGHSAEAWGTQGIAIGASTSAGDSDDPMNYAVVINGDVSGEAATAIGYISKAAYRSVGAGYHAWAQGDSAVAVGDQASAGEDDAVAIGRGATVNAGATGGVAIGVGATCGASNAIMIGNTHTVYVPADLWVGGGVVLSSPDGTYYRIVVANGGALSTVPV